MLDDRKQILRTRIIHCAQTPLQFADTLVLQADVRLVHLRGIQRGTHKIRSQCRRHLAGQALRHFQVLVRGQTKAKTEFGVVLKQRVRPGGSATFAIGGPRRHRQIAAVDGRAAGGVGDLQAVTEQLGQQLQVWCLAAAGAGAGVGEQRLEELHAADIGKVHACPIVHRECGEEGVVHPAICHKWVLVLHRERLGWHNGTGLHAKAATGAVLNREVEREADVGKAAHIDRRRTKTCRSAVELRRIEILCLDHAVRADEAALSALHAGIGVPYRDGIGDVALLPDGSAGRPCAIHR